MLSQQSEVNNNNNMVILCIVNTGGSLDTILFKKAIRLPEKVAVHIALQVLAEQMLIEVFAQTDMFLMQVAEAMHHLLSMTPPIFHRDLSTANVFLRRRNDYESVCLGDFGIAVEVANGEVYPNDPSDKSKNGNPRYRAPEVTLTGEHLTCFLSALLLSNRVLERCLSICF